MFLSKNILVITDLWELYEFELIIIINFQELNLEVDKLRREPKGHWSDHLTETENYLGKNLTIEHYCFALCFMCKLFDSCEMPGSWLLMECWNKETNRTTQ